MNPSATEHDLQSNHICCRGLTMYLFSPIHVTSLKFRVDPSKQNRINLTKNLGRRYIDQRELDASPDPKVFEIQHF